MRYLINVLLVLFIFSSLILKAQTDVVIRKKDFKAGESGFDEAWKHVVQGNKYFLLKGIWYDSAYEAYLKASDYSNTNPELNYKIGVSALFSEHKEKAAEFLKKAMELKSNVAEDILLLTGHSLQYTGKFSEAIEVFNKYLESNNRKSDQNMLMAKKYIEECNSAFKITSDTLRVDIVNAGVNINSTADDYSEIVTKDGKSMFFASRRGLPKSSSYYSDSKFDENIFVSARENDSWGAATLAGEDLTTHYCETPVFINSASDSLYIYTGYENGGDIKLSVKKKGKWKLPQQINSDINSKGNETSFTFIPSRNEIYFVSDQGKVNCGGKDIYYMKKISERKWSKPQNAGPLINSAYDEESVRFSAKGDTLWFSSRGHNSIGGFDIFYSIRNEKGEWDSVKNSGYPVNTPWDDAFFYPSPDDDTSFYFVSNRPGGFGGFDIYKGHFLPEISVLPAEAGDLPPH